MEYVIGRLLHDYERGKMSRRQLIRTLALTATAASSAGPASAAPPANAIYINHVSMQVADYRKSRDFYSSLFGMNVTADDGKAECRLTFGDNILIVRNAGDRSGKAGVDHIAYTLANWDTDKALKPAVEAELKRRGLTVRATGASSLHVQDPDGFDVQMGGKNQ